MGLASLASRENKGSGQEPSTQCEGSASALHAGSGSAGSPGFSLISSVLPTNHPHRHSFVFVFFFYFM